MGCCKRKEGATLAKHSNKIRTRNEWIADFLIHALFIAISILMLYPFIHVIMGSFMQYDEYFSKYLYLWVDHPTLDAYRIVLKGGKFTQALKNTIGITVFGTAFSMLCTSVVAYGLSKEFPGRKIMTTMIVITMFFSGGIIPQFIMFRQLGLINNYLVYILPAAINTYNLVILRTHFQSFPMELEEAARIDGCSDMGIFFKIVLPLSIPMLVTIALFYAVAHWNVFFKSVFYITKDGMRSLQDYLNRIIKAEDAEDLGMYISSTVSLETVRMANIVMSILPIIIVYPFLQKYFVKGAMVGAVKG